ncbi:uncharacterized protein LOC126895928 isoform X2 [Daktulosphaira vitifoliae]|uniref:uncharacterized protein LOC126895928 isoform X2 n=1 Tax=Daktulosphaira vitifoliae TaxID=58002 RepID=UPI0021AA78C4|nr:uncharacterized protein LOC126895928 isoform X2 [Daktulosphaira vitifoliae]
MDYIIKIAEMNFYLGLFIVLASSMNNLNEAEENSSYDITNDDVCIICHGENIELGSFNNCVHKICIECSKTMRFNYVCECPICHNENTEVTGVQPDTDNICYTCGKEPVTVDIGCINNHMTGNNCAYRAINVLQLPYNCLYCNNGTLGYKNVHEPKISSSEDEICLCKSEHVSHLLMPCNHHIGTLCSLYLRSNSKDCFLCGAIVDECISIKEFHKREMENIEKARKTEEAKKNKKYRALKMFLCNTYGESSSHDD